MAQPTENYMLRIGFMHAFGVASAEGAANLYEIEAKMGHTVEMSGVRAEEVPFAADLNAAQANVGTHPLIVKYFDLVNLKPWPNSNGQAWYYDDGNGQISDWIDPRDAQRIGASGNPESSLGYQVRLFRQDGTTQIASTAGTWLPIYHNGIILMASGQTPKDLGWASANTEGAIKACFFQYIGETVADKVEAAASSAPQWITEV